MHGIHHPVHTRMCEHRSDWHRRVYYAVWRLLTLKFSIDSVMCVYHLPFIFASE